MSYIFDLCCHFAIVFSESSDSAIHAADNDDEPSIGKGDQSHETCDELYTSLVHRKERQCHIFEVQRIIRLGT